MKVLTLTLILSICTVFAASDTAQANMSLIERFHAKMHEAESCKKQGQYFEANVAESLAEQYKNELKTAAKQAAANFVEAAKKNKGDPNWIKGAEASKLKEAAANTANDLSKAEKEYKDYKSAEAARAA